MAALAFASAAGLVAVLLLSPPPELVIVTETITVEVPAADYLAVLTGAEGQQHWVITARDERRQAVVRAVESVEPAEGRSLELWLLPPEEEPVPCSLGLLPA